MTVTVHHGDSREVLKGFADASIDSVVCDPPYALVSIGKRFGADNAAPAKAGKSGAYARASAGFMGQKWDTGETAFDPLFWVEVLRVLKPGGHLIAFSGTRTYHRLACAIEDAGFEMRDMIAWLYGSGFPKSHDVSKGIDKLDAAAARRERSLQFTAWMASTGITTQQVNEATSSLMGSHYLTQKEQPAVATREHLDAMRPLLGEVPQWVEEMVDQRSVESENFKRREVLGHHEKPAHAAEWRAEYLGGAVNDPGAITTSHTPEAQAWEGWGTALKPALEPVVLARKPIKGTVAANVLAHGTGALNIDASRIGTGEDRTKGGMSGGAASAVLADGFHAVRADRPEGGRWPANVCHDGSEEVVGAFPETAASPTGMITQDGDHFSIGSDAKTRGTKFQGHGDSGSAARFFYAVEKDAHCDLCRALLLPERATESPCNANTAEASSSTQSTLTDAIARAGAMGSPRPAPEGRARRLRASATSAESSSSGCLQPDSGSVPSPAPISEASSLAHNVRSAADLCGSCATAIAQSLAATRRGQDPVSLPCPASIDGRSWQILTSSLALHVEGRESTDTTTTIPSLKLLLGSVFHAIGDTTRPAKSAALENTESGPKRFHYSSKADAADRCGSKHPTVKPVDLMAYLVRLVTPPGGVTLDPFAGSGSTGMACLREGFDCILIEREAQYVADIHKRLAHVEGADTPLFANDPEAGLFDGRAA